MKVFIFCFTIFISFFSQAKFGQEICLVKWQNEENKQKYFKGLNLTEKERMLQELVFPRDSENLVVYYLTKEKDHIIRGKEINKDKIDKIINGLDFRSREYKKRARSFLALTGFKHTLKEAKEKLRGYRKVDCLKFREATYL